MARKWTALNIEDWVSIVIFEIPNEMFIMIANKCFYYEEEEFVDHLLDRYHEKRRYADYLEKEGSILAESSR